MDQTLLYIMAGFVILAAIAMCVQAGYLFGVYKKLTELNDKIAPLAPKVAALLETTKKSVEESSQQIIEITAKANDILDSARTQIIMVEDVMNATSRAKVQMERVEMVLDDTMSRAHETVALVHTGILRPLREINGVVAGVRAALGYLARGSRPNVAEVTSDEEMSFRVRRVLVLLLLCGLKSYAAVSAAELARDIQSTGLDPEECYRVVELSFSKQDVRVFLTSGYLIFAKPVNGVTPGAVFSADVEGGDGELMLLPPLRSERLSLVNFTGSPNLERHFRTALMIFTDNTAAELRDKIASGPVNKKAPEIGALLSGRWAETMHNLEASFEVRLVGDLLSNARGAGIFYMAVAANDNGNLDVIYDPVSDERIVVGQLVERNARTYFDTWTSLPAKASAGAAMPAEKNFLLDNYRIDATVEPDLKLKVTTKATLTSKEPLERSILLSISQRMRVSGATVDGQPVEVFQRDSLRSNLIHPNDNEDFLLVTPEPLDARPHEIEFQHEGEVIQKAGDGVYFVSARGTWYPRRGSDYAHYDLTFRYPRNLGLVSAGEIVEDRTDGDVRITRRKIGVPVRFAGFNLGDYQSVTVTHDPYRVEVFANRKLETALQQKNANQAIPVAPTPRRLGPEAMPEIPPRPAEPDPTARLEAIARDAAGAVDFFAGEFGPPPLRRLTVAPIPGGFGQGFPGLVYLATLAYLNPSQRPPATRDRFQQTFFSEMLDAHEVAHQWWGNLVIAAGYQDNWLMEALANYSALLFLEKRKGTKAMNAVLEDYKTHLLAKGPNGKSVESAGPITWGYRLQSSQAPDAWRLITYEKGTWILHMLRRRLGDEAFRSLLREICRKYQFSAISTDEFREMAERSLTPKSSDADLKTFFDSWVYGTGIPAMRFTHSVRGAKIVGTIQANDVSPDFNAYVPVETQQGRQKTLHWIGVSTEPSSFSIPIHAGPAHAALATDDALMIKQ